MKENKIEAAEERFYKKCREAKKKFDEAGNGDVQKFMDEFLDKNWEDWRLINGASIEKQAKFKKMKRLKMFQFVGVILFSCGCGMLAYLLASILLKGQ